MVQRISYNKKHTYHTKSNLVKPANLFMEECTKKSENSE